MHQPTSVCGLRAGGAADLAHGRRDGPVDVVVEAELAVLVARLAPVQEPDVVALGQQVLDERAAGPEVVDVRPVDQGEDEQDRHRRAAARPTGSGRAWSCGGATPGPSAWPPWWHRGPWPGRSRTSPWPGRPPARSPPDAGRRLSVRAARAAAWSSSSRSTATRTSSSLSSTRPICVPSPRELALRGQAHRPEAELEGVVGQPDHGHRRPHGLGQEGREGGDATDGASSSSSERSACAEASFRRRAGSAMWVSLPHCRVVAVSRHDG